MPWIPTLPLDEIPDEDVMPFSHNGTDYAIYQSPEGEYFATDGHCTHERELLCDGLVMGAVIECPKHNGRFDYTTGRALGPPVLINLRTYPTRVEDDRVWIELPD